MKSLLLIVNTSRPCVLVVVIALEYYAAVTARGEVVVEPPSVSASQQNQGAMLLSTFDSFSSLLRVNTTRP